MEAKGKYDDAPGGLILPDPDEVFSSKSKREEAGSNENKLHCWKKRREGKFEESGGRLRVGLICPSRLIAAGSKGLARTLHKVSPGR